MPRNISIIPKAGERVLIVGQTGSGKTAFACWLLERLTAAPIIIYDTKIEPKFSKFPASVIVENMDEALAYKDDITVDYIVVRPPIQHMLEPKLLDGMLLFHYLHFQHCPAYIDEIYTFQLNSRAGPGLMSLLTRGRSRGITLLMSSQRPKRLDRFCITEANKVYVFRLVDRDDRKRLDDLIPNYSRVPNPNKYAFYFFEEGMDEPILYKPIELDRRFDTGYTDIVGVEVGSSENPNNTAPTKTPIKAVWL